MNPVSGLIQLSKYDVSVNAIGFNALSLPESINLNGQSVGLLFEGLRVCTEVWISYVPETIGLAVRVSIGF